MTTPPTTVSAVLLVDQRIQGYDTIVSAVKSDVRCIVFDANQVSEVCSQQSITSFQYILNKIADIGVSSFANVGIVQHNSNTSLHQFFGVNSSELSTVAGVETSDPSLQTWASFAGFITTLKTTYGLQNVDLMACALYSNPDWKYIIDTLATQTAVEIRASTDDTGATALGGNWFLESHTGINLKSVYFTDVIDAFSGLLKTSFELRQKSTKGFATGSTLTWGTSGNGGSSSSVSSSLTSGVVAVSSTDNAFAALKSDGSVITWGDSGQGGNSSSVSSSLTSGVVSISSTGYAFAALKSNGSVITWGDSTNGGNSSSVSSSLTSGVVAVYSNYYAFAALKSDGSVITWGDTTYYGGNSSSVASSLASGVIAIYTSGVAFAALKSDGSVVSWGYAGYSVTSFSSVASSLTSGVVAVYSTRAAFAALKSDGRVITWGDSGFGADSTSVASSLTSGVVTVYSNWYAFAALKSDGSVITWGNSSQGGDSSSVASSLTSGVISISSNLNAFAALKNDGSVVVWGNPPYGAGGTGGDGGGSSVSAASSLTSGVVAVYSCNRAFAAIKTDGSVVTWGYSPYGGSSSSVASSLTSGVVAVYSTGNAFAALKNDGRVITWGNGGEGGDSSSVSVSSDVVSVYSAVYAFAVIKTTATTFDLSMAYYTDMDRFEILRQKENRRRVDLTNLNNNVFTISQTRDLNIINPNIPSGKILRIIVPAYTSSSSYSITSTATIPSGTDNFIIACNESEPVTISGVTYINFGSYVYKRETNNTYTKLTSATFGGYDYDLYGGDGVNSSGIVLLARLPSLSNFGPFPTLSTTGAYTLPKPTSNLDTVYGSTWAQVGGTLNGSGSYNYFGSSVCMSTDGTTVIVGAPQTTNPTKGYAGVYKNISGTWTLLGSLLYGDTADDHFGESVSISADGTIIAVGATQHNGFAASGSGYVKVFKYISSAWVQQGANITGGGSNFLNGSSVSLSANGKVLAIGERYNTTNGSNSGRGRIFSYDEANTTWTQLGGDIYGPSGSWFGNNISLSSDGSIVAISGPQCNTTSLITGGGGAGGIVRIFQYDSSKITNITDVSSTNFGPIGWKRLGGDFYGIAYSQVGGFKGLNLSSDGTMFAVGYGTYSNMGIARVFKYDASKSTNITTVSDTNFGPIGWYRLGSDLVTTVSEDAFGCSVSLSNDGTIVSVGGMYIDSNSPTNNNNVGGVKSYSYSSGNNTWSSLGQTLYGLSSWEILGGAISSSGTGSILAISANGGDLNGTDSGYVKIYNIDVSGGFTYSSNNASVAEVYSSVVVAKGNGTVVITAQQSGYNGFMNNSITANLTVRNLEPTYTFTVSKPQSITKTFGDATFSLSDLLTGVSNSSGAYTFATSNSGAISIGGDGVTATVAGYSASAVTITATQAAAGNYSGGSTTLSITVNGITPTYTPASPSASVTKTFGVDVSFSLTALVAGISNSNGAYTFSSASGAVSISGGVATIVAYTPSAITITAAQDASGNYASGSTAITVLVNRGTPTYQSVSPVAKTYGTDVSFSLAAVMAGISNSSGAYAFSVNPTITTQILSTNNMNNVTGALTSTQYQSNLKLGVEGDLVGWSESGLNHFVDLANTVGQTNTPNYAIMFWDTYTITQTTAVTNSNTLNAIYTVNFKAGPAVYFEPSQTTQATASDGIVFEILRANNTVLATSTYLPGAWAGYPTLTPSSFTYTGDGSGDVRVRIKPVASGTGRFAGCVDDVVISGPASSSSSSVLTISGNTATIIGAGTATVLASQDASGNYNASSTTISLAVAAATPTFQSVAQISKTFSTDVSFSMTPIVAGMSNSDGAFIFTTSGSAVGVIDICGAVVTILAYTPSAVNIDVYQEASGNYTYKTGTISLLVARKVPSYGAFTIPAVTYSPDGSFSMVPYAPTTDSPAAYSYTSSSSLVTASTTSTSGSWTVVSLSTTAQYKSAVVYGGTIWTSSNYGVSWTSRTAPGSLNWNSISVSGTGQYQTAVVWGGTIWTSSDYGVTWTSRTAPGSSNWYSTSVSITGEYQTAVAYGGNIWTSSNYGVTWTERSTGSTRNWFSISLSSTGQYQSAAVSGGYIWTSSDYGVTWTARTAPGNLYWRSISLSSTGEYQTAVVNSSGNIWTSSDFGVTWTVRTAPGSFGWVGVSVSGTGQYQSAAVSGGYIWTSSDYGVTWTSRTAPGSLGWNSISLSKTGEYQTAVVWGGKIWTSSNFGITWSQYASYYDVATISSDGTVVTVVGHGSTTITASQVATGNYAASSTTGVLTVNRAAPTFLKAFTIDNKVFGDAPFSLLPFTVGLDNTDGTYHFSSSNPSIVSISNVDNVTATILAYTPSPITITVDIDACGNYAAATTSGTLTVARAAPTYQSVSQVSKTFGVDASFSLTSVMAGISNSSGAYTFTSSSAAISISGAVATILAYTPEAVTITASQDASGNYTASSKTFTVLVARGTPTYQSVSQVAKTYGVDVSFSLTAVMSGISNSDGAYTFSGGAGAISISGGVATILAYTPSAVTLTATQDASGNYAASSKTFTLLVSRGTPTYQSVSQVSKTFGVDASFSLTDVMSGISNSDGAYTFSGGAGVISISSGVATILAYTPSAVTLTATQDASGNYAASSKTFTLLVGPGTPTLSNFNNVNKIYGNSPFSITPPTSNSSGAFTYTSSNTSVATITSINSTSLDFDGGNDRVTVANIGSFSSITLEVWVYNTLSTNGNNYAQLVSRGANGMSWDWALYLIPPDAGYPMNTLRWVGPGETTINTNVIELNTWTHVAVTCNNTQTKIYINGALIRTQSTTNTMTNNTSGIMFGNDVSQTRPYKGRLSDVRLWNIIRTDSEIANNYQLSLAGNESGLVGNWKLNQGTAGGNNSGVTTATDSSSSGKNGTLNNFSLSGSTSNWVAGPTMGSSITIVSPGTSTITATQDANGNYQSGSISSTLTVINSTPTYQSVSQISKTYGTDVSFSLASFVAGISDSSGAYTFSSSSAAISISGDVVTILGYTPSAASITATQAAAGNYDAASTTLSLLVGRATPTLNNFDNINKIYGVSPFAITPPTSNSSGAFTYTSSNTSVATISNSTNSTNSTNAINFDGGDDTIDYGLPALMTGSTGTQFRTTMTVECWFNNPGSPQDNYPAMVSRHYSGGDTNTSVFTLEVSDINKVRIFVQGENNNDCVVLTSPNRYSDSNWHHAAATFDGPNRELKLFVDGSIVATTTNLSWGVLSSTTDSLTNFRVGNARTDWDQMGFRGSIAEVRVWNVVRTPTEISNNYSKELIGNESGLILYNRLNQGTAGGNNSGITTTTNNMVSGGYTGTLNNFSLSGATSNWVAGPTMMGPTMTGPSITIVGSGTSTITAIQDTSGNYQSGSISSTLTVINSAPTYQSVAQISKTYGTDVSFSMTAVMAGVSNSSGAYTFSSLSDAISISGAVVTINAYTPSAITINATQEASGNYTSSSTTVTLLVSRKVPSYGAFTLPAVTYEDAPYSLVSSAPTSESNAAYSYTSSNTAVATVNSAGTIVTVIGQGYTTITASQDASGNYAAGSTTASLLVNRAAPTFLKAFTITDKTFGDASFSLLPFTDGLDNTDGTYHFSSSNASVVSISEADGVTATILAYSATPVTIYVAIDACGNYAASTTSGTLTINRKVPAYQAVSTVSKTFGDAAFSLVSYMTGISESSGSYTFASSDASAVSIGGDGVTATILAYTASAITITATQAASGNYAAGTKTFSLTVARGAPTIGALGLGPLNGYYDVSDGYFTLAAPTSNSSGAFTYASDNSAVAIISTVATMTTANLLARYDASVSSSYTLSGSNVTQWNDLTGNGYHLFPNGTGPTVSTINSVPSMEFNYRRALVCPFVPLTSSVTVFMVIRYSSNVEYWGSFMHHGSRDTDWAIERAVWAQPTQSLSFQSDNDMNSINTVIDTNYILVGRIVGNTRQFWTYSDTQSPSYVSSTPVTITPGNKPLFVGKSENTSASEACNSRIGEILYYNASLSDADLSANLVYLQNKWFNTTNTTSSGSSVVRLLTSGTANISATQDICGNYGTGSVSSLLRVGATVPTFGTFTVSSTTKTYGDGAFTITPPTSNSNGAFTITSSDSSIVSISGTTATIVAGGTVDITVTQDPSGSFTRKSVTSSFTVQPKNPNLRNFPDIVKSYADGSFTVTAPDTDGPGYFTYTASPAGVLTGGGMMNPSFGIFSGGSTVITATQVGSQNYAGSSITAAVTVTPIVPSASYSNFTRAFDVGSFTIPAPTTASSGTISYVSSDTSVATISGSTVTIRKVGDTTITATIAATTTYLTRDISAVFSVTRGTPSISGLYNQTITMTQAPFTLSPTSPSNGTFSYVSDNSAVVFMTNSGTTFNVASVGTATITATITQDTSANYNTRNYGFTMTVIRATSNLSSRTFAVPALMTYGDTPVNIITVPTSDSSGAITYTSANTNVATIHPTTGLITAVGAGWNYFVASQAETNVHNASTVQSNYMQFVSKTVTQTRVAPYTSSTITKYYGDASFQLMTSSDSTASKLFSLNTGGVVTLSTSSNIGYVDIINVGTVVITGQQFANSQYSTQNNLTWTLTVEKGTTSLTGLAATLTKNVTEAPFVVAVSSASAGTKSYALSNPAHSSVLTVDSASGLVTLKGPGTATIVASQAASSLYNAPTSVSCVITVASAGTILQGTTLTSPRVFDTVDMSGSSLANANVTSVSFTGSTFTNSLFTGATLTNSTLTNVNLSNSTMANTTISGTSFAGATMTRVVMTGSTLSNSTLTSTDLSGATMTNATITGSTFVSATMTNAVLTGATLTNSTMTSTVLTGASLVRANVTGSTFVGASLANADLSGATVTNANFTNANISGANITNVAFSPLQKIQLLKNTNNRAIGGIQVGDVSGSVILSAISESSPAVSIPNIASAVIKVVIPTTSTSSSATITDVVLDTTASDKFYFPINEGEYFQIMGVKYYTDGGIVKNAATNETVNVISYGSKSIWLIAGSIVANVLAVNTLSASTFTVPPGKMVTDSSFNITVAPTSNSNAPIVYSSNNPSVATIHPSTGVITIVGQGYVNFIATQAATLLYEAGTKMSNTLNVNILVNFTLNGLNQTILMTTSGLLDGSGSSLETTDATAVFYVKVSDMTELFKFQTDSLDLNDDPATDIKYYVFNRKWPAALKINPAHAMLNKTESNGMLGSASMFTDNKMLAKHDFIRYLSQQLFNTIFGVDLFSNESDLLENATYWGENVRVNINNILAGISTTSSDASLNYDVSGNKYLTNAVTADTNLCRELVRQMAAAASSRFGSITDSKTPQSVPFLENDSINFKVTFQSTATQNMLTGVESIPTRSYMVRLVMKNSISGLNTAVIDSEMFPNAYPYSSAVTSYAPTSASSAVYNSYSPPAPMPFARFGFDGWYYTNSTAWVTSAYRNHIKWLMPANSGSSTVGSLQYIRVNLKIHNKIALPYIMVYTQSNSTRKYTVTNTGALVNGTTYSFYVNFNSYTRAPATIGFTNAAMSNTDNTGSFANNELIMNIALETDISAAAGTVDFTLSSVVIGDASGEKEYGFEADVPAAYP